MGKHDHHDGLDYHLRVLRSGALKRRDMVRWALGTGLVTLVGCGNDSDEPSGAAGSGGSRAGSGGRSGSGGTGGAGGQSGSCTKIPEETAGPYPADGSNGASGGGGPGMGGPGSGNSDADVINALAMTGVVRKDIRSSFGGSSSTQAEGVPLSIKLRIRDTSCQALAGAAVYLWHCDRSGNYSLYSQAIASENYLRGVQEADDEGYIEFESIFPACYSGRWPHIHFEIYPSLAKATVYSNKLATSQLALPKDTCDTVFATDGYEASITNFKMVSLTTDNVFSDGSATQLPSISGSVDEGYEVELYVNVAA
jgi:protocatechuate 3,4-dioxygenase beta subunit